MYIFTASVTQNFSEHERYCNVRIDLGHYLPLHGQSLLISTHLSGMIAPQGQTLSHQLNPNAAFRNTRPHSGHRRHWEHYGRQITDLNAAQTLLARQESLQLRDIFQFSFPDSGPQRLREALTQVASALRAPPSNPLNELCEQPGPVPEQRAQLINQLSAEPADVTADLAAQLNAQSAIIPPAELCGESLNARWAAITFGSLSRLRSVTAPLPLSGPLSAAQRQHLSSWARQEGLLASGYALRLPDGTHQYCLDHAFVTEQARLHWPETARQTDYQLFRKPDPLIRNVRHVPTGPLAVLPLHSEASIWDAALRAYHGE